MSLSGNLGFVSLDEVLRLLTRSKQRGTVDVRGEKARGRIFVDRGGIGLATTFTDEHLQRHLIKSCLVDSETLSGITAGTGDLASITEQDGGAMTALLREMTVETIYQLGLQGESFEVIEGETSPYAHPKPFELEDLLADSKQRLSDWTEVTSIVSDLERHLRFRRDLGERDQVTIAKDAWQVLSEVGPGRSVRSLAEELGTTEFWTARVAARLIEDDLLTLEHPAVTDQPAVVEAPALSQGRDGAEEYAPPTGSDQPAEPIAVGPDPAADVYTPAVDAEVDPNQSWWKEPDHEPAEEKYEDESPTAETAWAEHPTATEPVAETDPEVGEESDVEEDTEAFLEKVFSDMESGEETDEGYGLLRRRRMGVLRDISNE